jgi:arginyl-tRNA synthetase
MTYIHQHIATLVKAYFKEAHQIEPDDSKIVLSNTKDDFDGDFTLVVFPLAGIARSKPDVLANMLGGYLTSHSDLIDNFSVVKGFLNLTCNNGFWIDELSRQTDNKEVIPQIGNSKIVLEYASPNSNKPLHLGHIRNILLGWSVGQLLKAVGHDVHFTQVVNDRGIAICKSMLAWKKFYAGTTPESKGMKPDHFVGEAYVRFNTELEKEYKTWQQTPEAAAGFEARKAEELDKAGFFKSFKNDYFNQHSQLGKETRDMLLAWEANDADTRALWRQMNNWFMAGFKETCHELGIHFDSENFESDTYLLGKDIVQEGLDKGIFYREDDGSVWADLSDAGLDKKIILRGDGTSVYITQDLGTARIRYADFKMDGMIYTVGNEQNYHFEALFEVLKRLGEPYADKLYHLSYGMVDLPSGRMKAREGTIVDADDLIHEVVEAVKKNSQERGELDMLDETEKAEIFNTIGLGALKYYMLRVDAKKRMLFNPEESVDLHGQTGPYIQNAYVRIKSIMRKLGDIEKGDQPTYDAVNKEEKQLLQTIMSFGDEVVSAVNKYDPSVIASFAYQLARHFHRFYHDHSIVRAESEQAKSFRQDMVAVVAHRLELSMKLLGISMPQRM